MKVSKQWISDYLGFELPETTELVEKIGAQLGAVEEINNIGAQYEGVVVVKVVECSKLENSDHLNLCFIDDNGITANVNRRDDGLVQVVCGAPNVKAGVTVAWLPPGATVPSTYATEPFVLEARELRGTVSNGMLASPKELAIGDGHEGLLLLDDTLAPGTGFIDAYKLDDYIVDIENKMFTHRPDCFGQLGVAREVAGIFGQQFTSPDWYLSPLSIKAGNGLTLQVKNEIPAVVPRFMAVALKDVTIAPSPVWLQTQLSRVGIRPINNVVDITNYMMILTGQPLHAYDYDKVAAISASEGATIVVRYPNQDEELKLLSGKSVTPRAEAIMIATDQQAIGLGGVMGGGNTEVDASTKNIILECASFDMYSIRRTSMAHGLFTDAVTRFNKGQSSLQNPSVLAKAVAMFEELAGGSTASEVIDVHEEIAVSPSVTVEAGFINDRLGLSLSANNMAELLRNVEFNVTVKADSLTVIVPFWRTDIEISEDIVEEVGRLYGFDKLPLELPQRDITPAAHDLLLAKKIAIRNSLVKAGANELLTYSFVHGNLLDKSGQNRDQAYKLSNALSPDLQYYRLTALPSLLDKVHANIKAGHNAFALFELSKGHDKTVANTNEGVPVEFEDLDFVYASKTEQAGAAFYQVRRYLDVLASDLGLRLSYKPVVGDPKDPVSDPYDLSRSAQVWIADGGPYLGIIGEFKDSVRKSFKLPSYSAGFTISTTAIVSAVGSANVYQALPRYPNIEQDICLRVSSDLSFSELDTFANSNLNEHKPEHTSLQLTPIDIYQSNEEPNFKNITFRVALASFERTMTEPEMTKLLNQLSEVAAAKFQAQRI